jgi:hypothetical protein
MMAEPGLAHSPHTTLSVQQFLGAKNMAVITHPPYVSDLVPCDFLLPSMKSDIKQCRFQDVSGIQEQSLTVLHLVPKCQFQQWQKCWTHCINSKEDYTEGDNNNQ